MSGSYYDSISSDALLSLDSMEGVYSLPVIEKRLRVREKTIPKQEVSAARWWVSRLENLVFADHVVDNSHRPPREVAEEVLHVLGWL